MYLQEIINELNQFWVKKGCLLWQPYHTEVGAATSNPATFFRSLGPEPWWVAHVEPCIRPTDGRYADNPNRLQHYFQYQVILKPSPTDVQELFLQSLESLGLDLTKHDFRFVEDNWQSPSLGAWGLGWEVWLDGMEILQFTYFQECGGIKLDMRACELTYGIERIAMYLQNQENVFDLKWAPTGETYGDIFRVSEIEFCNYNFKEADEKKLFESFNMWEKDADRLLELNLIAPAYDHCLRLSHLFNLLDARGALSVMERSRFLFRCRSVAQQCAQAFLKQRDGLGFPLNRISRIGSLYTNTDTVNSTPVLKEKDTLLIEIGTEEIPHVDIIEIQNQLPDLVEKYLSKFRIEHEIISVYSAPRRIAIKINNAASKQKDFKKEIYGPAKAACFDKDGRWSQAAVKFSKAHGIKTADLIFKKRGKNENCVAIVVEEGKSVHEVFSEIITLIVKNLSFSKRMGWENTDLTFSRPIRWIVGLFGKHVLPFKLKLKENSKTGIQRFIHSNRSSFGHRRLADSPFDITQADAYLETLRKHQVIADRFERMVLLKNRIKELAEKKELNVKKEHFDLFEEVCDLVEYPCPVLGQIPEEFLDLPEEIIITPMKVHQRYFPLHDRNGKLSRYFITVINGEYSADAKKTIVKGNEKVLNARLKDARYFWNSDMALPLESFAKRLDKITFHEDLGSVGDKIERLEILYDKIKDQLPACNDKKIKQVLKLMKADLATQMVGEFTSLEGVVGKLYAQKQGYSDEIAKAIYEHHLPRFQEDILPESNLGVTAAILDRIDTLAGYFGIGIKPSGSGDIYGLRRNAYALLSIINSFCLDINLETIFYYALEVYGNKIADHDQSLPELLSFIQDRLAARSKNKGFDNDIILAVLSCHGVAPLSYELCLETLNNLDNTLIQNIAEQAKRMSRIIKEPAKPVDTGLFESEDQKLFDYIQKKDGKIKKCIKQQNFLKAFSTLKDSADVIADYFNNVLINHEKYSIKQNRHALLRKMLEMICAVVDFKLIEKNNQGDR